MSAPSQSPAAERMRASAAEARVKIALVQDSPTMFAPVLDETLRCAASVDEAADEIDRLTEEVARLTRVLMRIETARGLDDVLGIARAALPRETT